MLTIIVENGLWCTWAACFIRMNNVAERVHQRPLKQQQYCLTKPKGKGQKMLTFSVYFSFYINNSVSTLERTILN